MRTRAIIRKAKRDGRYAGHTAASWLFDGNTKQETYRHVLTGIEDGDPAVLDAFTPPNLSGEWGGDDTPSTLASDYDLDEVNDPYGWRLDEACTAWEDAASGAFWSEIERIARYHLA